MPCRITLYPEMLCKVYHPISIVPLHDICLPHRIVAHRWMMPRGLSDFVVSRRAPPRPGAPSSSP